MTQRTYIRCLLGIGALVFGAVIWLCIALIPEDDNRPSGSRIRDLKPAKGRTDRSESRGAELPSAGFRGHKPRIHANDGTVHLAPGDVLALVNRAPIEVSHLMPILKNDDAVVLTDEEYSSRLKRAIEMEIVLQAALAEGVVLTDAQQARVDGLGEGDQAEMDHYRKYGLTWKSTGAGHIDFEKRLLNAQLLEQNLVAKRSEVEPSTAPGIQSRYEEARVQLLALLHDRAEIDLLIPGRAK